MTSRPHVIRGSPHAEHFLSERLPKLIVTATFVVMMFCLLYLVTGLDLGVWFLVRQVLDLFWAMIGNSRATAAVAIVLASIFIVAVMIALAVVVYDFLEDRDALIVALDWHGRIEDQEARKRMVEYAELWPDWYLNRLLGSKELRAAWMICAHVHNAENKVAQHVYSAHQELLATVQSSEPTPFKVALLGVHFKATGDPESLRMLVEISRLHESEGQPPYVLDAAADAVVFLVGYNVLEQGHVPSEVHAAIARIDKILSRKRANGKLPGKKL